MRNKPKRDRFRKDLIYELKNVEHLCISLDARNEKLEHLCNMLKAQNEKLEKRNEILEKRCEKNKRKIDQITCERSGLKDFIRKKYPYNPKYIIKKFMSKGRDKLHTHTLKSNK